MMQNSMKSTLSLMAVSVLFASCPSQSQPNDSSGTWLVVENETGKDIFFSMEQDFLSAYAIANNAGEQAHLIWDMSIEWTNKGPIDFYKSIICNGNNNVETREQVDFIMRIDNADSVITLFKDDRDGHGLLTYKLVITDAMLEQKTTGVLLVIENESSKNICMNMDSFSAAHTEKKEVPVSMNKSAVRINWHEKQDGWTNKGPIDFHESIHTKFSDRKWKEKGNFITRIDSADPLITLLEDARDAGGYGLLSYKLVVTDAMLGGEI